MMFIRESNTKNKKTKTTYSTHKLVENYRTDSGVRQRVIMSLGTLALPKKRWKELAALLESRISGQKSFVEDDEEIAIIADDVLKHNKFIKIQRKETAVNEENQDMQLVDLNSASTSIYRSLGAELIANTFWGKLDFDTILKDCGFDLKQLSIAKAVILGRLLHPQSEIGNWRWFQNSTSLIEMTPVDLSDTGKDLFYEIGDLLLEHKEEIEKALFMKEQREFSLKKRVYLYDLTNTYFEGNAKGNKKANLGHSKEKRTDCALVTLALVLMNLGSLSSAKFMMGGRVSQKL